MKAKSNLIKRIVTMLILVEFWGMISMNKVQANDKTIFMDIDFEPVFDAQYYAKYNPDIVQTIGVDEKALFQHFIISGMKEGRTSSKNFDINAYINNNPDLVEVFGTQDLSSYYVHYAAYGVFEGRIAINALYGEYSLPLSEADQENVVYEKLVSMKNQYPEGMRYTNDNSYVWIPYLKQYNVLYTGFGCAGFSFLMSDSAFGEARITKHKDISRIRVGDILRLNNNSHSVVVLEVKDNGVVVVEGNYNSSIHWGRYIKWNSLRLDYVFTRYE